MKILSIETSCDETAVAVVKLTGDLKNPEFSVLGQALYSQVKEHAEFGGVYPNLAKRLHGQNLVPLATKALKDAFAIFNSQFSISSEFSNTNFQTLETILEREKNLLAQLKDTPALHENPGVDAVAVTRGPGLEPALWVGINFAKALSYLWNVPLVPVNHMEGHIFSVLTNGENVASEKLQVESKKLFPAIALLVSGGHTELVLVNDWFEYEILGRTQDDAVGEAFDKVARLLELPYPGGPEISRLAAQARDKFEAQNSKSETPVVSEGATTGQAQNDAESPASLPHTYAGSQTSNQKPVTRYQLPRPMIGSGNYNFSYSGLKTAVRRIVDEKDLDDEEKTDLAREFEDAALDVLITKTERALQEFAPQHLIVAGGVIANIELRKRLTELVEGYNGITLALPTRDMATDNAIMIGIAGALHFAHTPDAFSVFDPKIFELKADGNWRVDSASR